MASDVDLNEFLAGYLAEVEEHLASASKNLLAVESALDRGEGRPRAVRELFRSLHTIKGLSAMVGVEQVVDLSHEMEAVLRAADRAGGTLSSDAVRLLVQGVRAVELRVQALEVGKPVPPAPQQLLDALRLLVTGSEGAAPSPEVQGLDPDLAAKLSPSEKAQLVQGLAAGRAAWQIEFIPTPARIEAGLGITAIRARLEAVAEIVRVMPRALPASADAPGGLSFILLVLSDEPPAAVALAADTAPNALIPIGARPAESWSGEEEGELDEALDPGRAATSVRTIRVPVERLDDALDKLSALVVTRFRLSRAVADLVARGVAVGELGHIVAESGRQLRDLRNSFMRARMVSVAELLERVPLLVRGLRSSTGKDVRLEIEAGRAELDKAVGDRIFPALVHIIRNAVDHGIETPADRRAAGKLETGLIRVICLERVDNQLELSITDDGRGIDVDKLARRAGRPPPETDDQLLDLITLRGVSSADRATATSGRGMGMDIVQRVALELGGELAVHTRPGAGTTFVVRVPLTITIVDAFTLTCSSRDFAVPVSSVEEIIEVDAVGDTAGGVPFARGAVAGTRLFERRGEAVPLVPLHALLGLAPPGEPPRKALVVRRNGQPYAFAVDRMMGRQEVVIRPLEDPLTRVIGVTGSTDLGDGRPTLVLDLIGFSRTLVSEEARP